MSSFGIAGRRPRQPLRCARHRRPTVAARNPESIDTMADVVAEVSRHRQCALVVEAKSGAAATTK